MIQYGGCELQCESALWVGTSLSQLTLSFIVVFPLQIQSRCQFLLGDNAFLTLTETEGQGQGN